MTIESRACLACLREVPGNEYHVTCLRTLFGTDTPPAIDVTEATLQTLALATLGHAVVPGVQPKISLGLVRDRRRTLRIGAGGAVRYLLKPQNADFPALPENEHLSMRIGALFGLVVPAFGLVRLRDGSLAYIVARFDRLADGGKLRQEDFAQLAGIMPSAKYDLDGADLARLIDRYSDRRGADLVRLFERFVLTWWIGDGDLHAKNLSLLAGPDGRHGLSPAYDVVSTAVYKEYSSALALPLARGDERMGPEAWRRFAATCRLLPAAASAILARPAQILTPALDLVRRSYLPTRAMQSDYTDCLRVRAEHLTAAA